MSDSSLENRLVDVFTQIAKDIKSHSGGSSSGSSSSLEFSDLKKVLNSKGYYCKDATLQSLLECIVSSMSNNTIDISYEKTLTSITFTSLPRVVFTIDDVKYTTGSDGTYIYTIPRDKRVVKVKLYGYGDSVIKEFNVSLLGELIDFDALLRDGVKITTSNQYELVNFKTNPNVKTYVITSTYPVNGDNGGYVGGIMWKLGASATDNMNIIIDGSAENYVTLNYLRYSFIKYGELNHKVRIFVRHTTQDSSKGTYNSPDRYITTDLHTPNRGLISVYTEKLTEFVKKNYGIDRSVVQKMKEVYGVLGDDVLCGIYTLDGSVALVYRPSKVKFEYVSIV